jgi:hypothetical protein
VYVGDYGKGYMKPPSRCLLYRSSDRGGTWTNLGVVLQGDSHMFDRGGHTPDVSVVYADKRYHMVYDWGTANFNEEGGLAYAWAEKPEGPWHRAEQPITRNTALPKLLGRYHRTYSATLVRRAHDWLILAMMDDAPCGWAMFAITALNPDGPYGERRLVRNVEAGYYHPPLMEFMAAFTYGDYVYAPATSVALNRNFNVIFRAPLERADDPAAWSIFEHGSVWHSEDVENEFYGIWGQNFSGGASLGQTAAPQRVCLDRPRRPVADPAAGGLRQLYARYRVPAARMRPVAAGLRRAAQPRCACFGLDFASDHEHAADSRGVCPG